MMSSFLAAFDRPDKCHKLITLGLKHYYLDTHEPTQYNLICGDSVDRLFKTTVRTIATIIASLTLAFASGLYTNFASGRHETLFSFNYIFVAIGSDAEYYINVAFQSMFAIVFVMGNIGLEMFILLFENALKLSTTLAVTWMENLAHDMDADLSSDYEAKEALVRMLKEVERCNGWISECKEYLYWRFFLSPYAITYTIGFCVLCQYIVRCISNVDSFKIFRPILILSGRL